MRIICNNTFENKLISAQTKWEIQHRATRAAARNNPCDMEDSRTVAVLGCVASWNGWNMLASIRAEIAPQIQALRARQEVLESIGTRVNGGF